MGSSPVEFRFISALKFALAHYSILRHLPGFGSRQQLHGVGVPPAQDRRCFLSHRNQKMGITRKIPKSDNGKTGILFALGQSGRSGGPGDPTNPSTASDVAGTHTYLTPIQWRASRVSWASGGLATCAKETLPGTEERGA